jgi:hypothetical protein
LQAFELQADMPVGGEILHASAEQLEILVDELTDVRGLAVEAQPNLALLGCPPTIPPNGAYCSAGLR